MHWSMDSGSAWLWMTVMMVVVLAFLAALLWAAVSRDRRSAGTRSDARRILEERFARGEISKEEYEDRLRTIRAA